MANYDYIERAIYLRFMKKLVSGKVVVLLGARRTGKTMFLKKVVEKLKEPYLLMNGEDADTSDKLQRRSVENFKKLLGNRKLLIIDEAQKINDIGNKLKLMIDEISGLKIIATGSSAFDLTGRLGEPLTGRQHTFFLYPLAQMEFAKTENALEAHARLEDRLIYGSYPELIHKRSREEKEEYLNEVVSAYLLKDLLVFEGMRNSSKLMDLLRLIAFQVGKQVSYQELAVQLGISKNTVERYLDLLSKVFVLHKVQGYSRNLRKEITKSSRWYFCDNGIRNALIANFNPLALRNDAGELWENYMIAERIKFQRYTALSVNNYFWRTYQQQEIDWVEERGGGLYGFEMKWNSRKKISAPSAWRDAYPEAKFQVVNPGNYLKWIGG